METRALIETQKKLFLILSDLVIILSIAIIVVYFYRAFASPAPPTLPTVGDDPPGILFPKDLE